MARDVVALMRGLGHGRFAVVGHDRGSCVALRTALDHPGAVTHLAVLDCIPIVEHLDRADARFATAWWHWFFFAQPHKPERAIGADPDAWDGGDPVVMGEENHADFRRAVHDPDTVRAMLEDYRAGLTVDRAAEEADRAAGRRVACPTIVLWSARGPPAGTRRELARGGGQEGPFSARRQAHRQRPPHGGGGPRRAGGGPGPVPRDGAAGR